MKKNIAIIASYIHPVRQKHLLDWYILISKEFANTKLFIGSKNKKIPYATNYKINTKVERLKYKLINLINFRKIPIELKKIQPLINNKSAIIHLLTSNAFENIEPLITKNNIKLIVSFRGYDINVFPQESLINKRITQRIFKKADVLHFISEDLRNKAIKLNANPQKCVVINRSITINKSENSKATKKNNKLIILSVGRLVWEKGYLFALETIAILKNNGFDFEYHIVGSGIDYNMLYFHMNRLKILDVVKFKGELSTNAVKQELLLADIYFQPSVSEALSMAIIEASYYKLPIVSSKIGGIPELVEHGITGFLSPPCQPENYAKNIISLIKNKNLRLQMGSNAHQRVINNFSRKIEIENWKSLYESLN